ncbi:hypothetical protein ACFE04_000594 [Oxalis oulophora]
MSEHPVKPYCLFQFMPTNFTERCLHSGNPEALFNRGICLLRQWHVDATMYALKKATKMNHLATTYIYWSFKMSNGCLNAWEELSIKFATRDGIDWCRYIVWSGLSNVNVLNFYATQNSTAESFQCSNPKNSIYPLLPGVAGSDEIEWPPYNKKNCSHRCFWSNEITLYMGR